jgi:hypothetical protein
MIPFGDSRLMLPRCRKADGRDTDGGAPSSEVYLYSLWLA